LGNLLSRVVKLLQQPPLNGTIPGDNHPDDLPDLEAIVKTDFEPQLSNTIEQCVHEFSYNQFWDRVWERIKIENRRFDAGKPWSLIKTSPSQAGFVLRGNLEAIHKAAIALYPVMPSKVAELRTILSCRNPVPTPHDLDETLRGGAKIDFPKPLFPRIDFEKVLAQEQKVKELSVKIDVVLEKLENNLITIDEFKKAELRVAQILKAEKIEGATKLLLLQLDDGDGAEHPRQIVAGIAEFYSPDVLIGQKVVIVANLKPTKIRGNESNGMLLAAKADGKLVIVTVASDISNGASVG
jgi:methionyl-tRNA synthetase